MNTKALTLGELLITCALIGVAIGVLMVGYQNLNTTITNRVNDRNVAELGKMAEAFRLMGGDISHILNPLENLSSYEQAVALTNVLQKNSNAAAQKQHGQIGGLLGKDMILLPLEKTEATVGQAYLAVTEDFALEVRKVGFGTDFTRGFKVVPATSDEAKVLLTVPVNSIQIQKVVSRVSAASRDEGARYADNALGKSATTYIWNTDDVTRAGPTSTNTNITPGVVIPTPSLVFVVSYLFTNTENSQNNTPEVIEPLYTLGDNKITYASTKTPLRVDYLYNRYQFDTPPAPTTGSIRLMTSDGHPADWRKDVDLGNSRINVAGQIFSVAELLDAPSTAKMRKNDELVVRLPEYFKVNSGAGFTGTTDDSFTFAVRSLTPSAAGKRRGIESDSGNIPSVSVSVQTRPARLLVVMPPKQPNGSIEINGNVLRYLSWDAYAQDELKVSVGREDGLPLRMNDIDLGKSLLLYNTNLNTDLTSTAPDSINSGTCYLNGVSLAGGHWAQGPYGTLVYTFRPSDTLSALEWKNIKGAQMQFYIHASANAQKGEAGREPVRLPPTIPSLGSYQDSSSINGGRILLLNAVK